MAYDRYKAFRTDGKISVLSGKWHSGYDWLILMANPELGNMEFEIPDGSIMRIPYPLNTTLESYSNQIEKFNKLYGLE